MVISTQTVVVVGANLLVTIVGAALMLLVLWQAPRQRSNQIFALMMFTLLMYSLINLLGRFAGALNIDADTFLDANGILYIWFGLELLLFLDEFTRLRIRWLKAGILALTVISTALVALDLTNFNTRPSATDIGGYVTDYTPLGFSLFLVYIAILVGIILQMRRAQDPRPRAVWPALACIVGGLLLLSLRPLSALTAGDDGLFDVFLTVPWNSLGLSAAAVVLGRAVLKYQLFDPAHQLNLSLEQANRELEEANRLKSRFLANISHELRTPLNSIIGYTQLVLDGLYGPVTDVQNERLSRVVRNGRSLLTFINDLLDISKIQAGEMILAPARVESGEMIRAVMAAVEPLAEKKGLTLTCDFVQSPAIQVDEGRARQILHNIVGNAVKFTAKGSVALKTNVDGDFLRIAVADTGIGIPEEALTTLFQEFRQVDGSSTREFEGTGLGLSIARRLAELHGGRIEVESAPGVGSTFTVWLPLAPSQPEAQETTAPPEQVTIA